MIAVVVNAGAIVVGSLVGLLFKKGIPEKYADVIMKGIALCTIYIGITGTMKGNNVLVLILSIVIGGALGTMIDIDKGINQLGVFVESKMKKSKDGSSSIARGFVTASLLFCVGAMAVVGSLNAGINGDYELLFTKSVMDLVTSAVLAVSLGAGVLLSAGFLLIFQGSIVILAQFLGPFLIEATIAELVSAGSLVIVALGLNVLGMTNLKVANYLPALLVAPIIMNIFLMF